MFKITSRWLSVTSLLLLFMGLPFQTVLADQGDPPARVARLSVIQGKLSFQPAGESQWSEVSVNRTVSTGDRLYTDQQSRAELEVGSFAVRLSETTDLTVANLNDQLLQLGLGQGSIRVSVYDLPPNNTVEIDTPNGALTLEQNGSYRVDIAPDGNSTFVTVIAGRLEVTGGDLRQDVGAGRTVQLTGTGPIAVASAARPQPDDFDRWCADRDRRIEQYRSAKYVSRDVPGAEDLDEYGTWRNEPEYGPVWVPARVAPDWVPYRVGHWAWIEPWGWTWVDDEPWGFVPFHYGRWAHLGPIWCWVPGPVVVRPVYAPALVAFVGGGGFHIGIGIGIQAWFPLGPREPFVPWYHYGPTYLHQVNVTNVRNVNITNINVTNINYANRGVATTAVSGDAFRGGRSVSQSMVRVNQHDLAQARVIPHPDVTPARTAVFGGRNVAAPPVRAASVTRPEAGARGQAPAARSYPTAAPSGSRSTPPTSGRFGVPAGNSPTTVARPAPSTAGRFAGPPSTPPRAFVTRNPVPQQSVPFTNREPALSSHPGRPLEPQQVQNLRKGQAAGPMKDREVIPHAEKAEKGSRSAPKAAPREGGGRQKR